MTELPCDAEDSRRAHRVDEERVRTVEGVDVAEGGRTRGRVAGLLNWYPGPARGLDGAARLERELVIFVLPFVVRDPFLAHEPAQVAKGREIVEPVVVH